ncbi:cysteine hydrolase family protein [Ancylobacter radicis]|uniref:Cysteine hydrolase n=1 Tax=Ancylobacter radicis TaxID=2836179 RepID=A0ABS5RDW3_9HYPH|nr:cysteine hydrolase family protein [Ancylobacter radicis]MBS9479116.1 cysteine hydrolase [Ancylobacter radicis]
MSDTALLIIDLQNDYFPEGRYPLVGIEAAAAKAGDLLATARQAGVPVVHVRHEMAGEDAPFFARGTAGADIHPRLAPLDGETVVVKEEVNAFLRTDLDRLLRERGIARLVIAGAMSHMCVDAASRAALDLGYEVTLAHDATATLDLAFGGTDVPAANVQAALMAALEFAGAKVVPTADAAAVLRG